MTANRKMTILPNVDSDRARQIYGSLGAAEVGTRMAEGLRDVLARAAIEVDRRVARVWSMG
ncbi:MAG: hypothetical protein ACREFG_09445 [Chthoniobacterales bacterium]